jgi:hypothetical protein
MTEANNLAVRWALEAAGVEFIDETVVDQACVFGSRQSRNAESRPRRFCETNPILFEESKAA